MYIECDEISPVLLGMEILARYAAIPGTVSALDVQVQLVGHPRQAPAAQNHRRALETVLKTALPSESLP
jgi:hypothetical protein